MNFSCPSKSHGSSPVVYHEEVQRKNTGVACLSTTEITGSGVNCNPNRQTINPDELPSLIPPRSDAENGIRFRQFLRVSRVPVARMPVLPRQMQCSNLQGKTQENDPDPLLSWNPEEHKSSCFQKSK